MNRLLLVLARCASSAQAAPPEGADLNSPLAMWYRSLTAPNGDLCCSVADCRPVVARLQAGRWEILDEPGTDHRAEGDNMPLLGAWTPVPDDVVLKRENMDGRPIACRWGGKVRCFIPPAGV